MIRTLRSSLLVCIVLLGLLAGPLAAPVAAGAPPATAEWTHVVSAWLGLRMRSGPSLTHPITLVLFNDEDVRVKGDPVWAQGIRWSNVTATRRIGAFEGWVASAHLANYPGYEEPMGHFVGEGYKVMSSVGLRLRSAPGISSPVMRIVPYGTILVGTGAADVLASGLVWRQLSLNGQTVWAAARFLTRVP